MPDKAWKAFERRIAATLGTVRTPLSGSGSRHTTGDTLHPHLYVECKLRKRLAVRNLFFLTQTTARLEDKIPVLALHQRGMRGTLAVIDWDFFLKLWEAYAKTKETARADQRSDP